MSPESERLAGDLVRQIPIVSDDEMSAFVRKHLEMLADMEEINVIAAQILVAVLDQFDLLLARHLVLEGQHRRLGNDIAQLRHELLTRSGVKSILS